MFKSYETTISVVSDCVFGQEDPRGLLGAQLEWIWNKYNTLIFHINIDHVFQLNILLKITFNAFKMEVDYSKKYLEDSQAFDGLLLIVHVS